VTAEPRATFRPHERIRDPNDFRRAFERRRSAADPTMVVYAVENGRDHPRLGLSVGRKKVRKAFQRNRAKRLLREAFRLGKADLPAGVDFVVTPRGPLDDFAQTQATFLRLARDAARRLGPRPPRPGP
jgi:ribonuclease P protein component